MVATFDPTIRSNTGTRNVSGSGLPDATAREFTVLAGTNKQWIGGLARDCGVQIEYRNDKLVVKGTPEQIDDMAGELNRLFDGAVRPAEIERNTTPDIWTMSFRMDAQGSDPSAAIPRHLSSITHECEAIAERTGVTATVSINHDEATGQFTVTFDGGHDDVMDAFALLRHFLGDNNLDPMRRAVPHFESA